jgi:hypothetical protein
MPEALWCDRLVNKQFRNRDFAGQNGDFFGALLAHLAIGPGYFGTSVAHKGRAPA